MFIFLFMILNYLSVNRFIFIFNKNEQKSSQSEKILRLSSNSNANSNYACNRSQASLKKNILIERLSREKCELISTLQLLKQKIQEIEMRQNQAIREVSILNFFVF